MALTSVDLDVKKENNSLRLHLATEILCKCVQQQGDGNEWAPLESLWSHVASHPLRQLLVEREEQPGVKSAPAPVAGSSREASTRLGLRGQHDGEVVAGDKYFQRTRFCAGKAFSFRIALGPFYNLRGNFCYAGKSCR